MAVFLSEHQGVGLATLIQVRLLLIYDAYKQSMNGRPVGRHIGSPSRWTLSKTGHLDHHDSHACKAMFLGRPPRYGTFCIKSSHAELQGGVFHIDLSGSGDNFNMIYKIHDDIAAEQMAGH